MYRPASHPVPHQSPPPRWHRCGPVLLALLLGVGAAGPLRAGDLQPFRSDGCSSFPDRAVLGHADWCHCCVAHDRAYWRGGTAAQRLQADEALRRCVSQASGKPAVAELMFLGVRAGGGPELHTTYRWGYGWPLGRPYGPLSAAETAEADALAQQAGAEAVPATCRPAPGPADEAAASAATPAAPPTRTCGSPAASTLTAPQSPAP